MTELETAQKRTGEFISFVEAEIASLGIAEVDAFIGIAKAVFMALPTAKDHYVMREHVAEAYCGAAYHHLINKWHALPKESQDVDQPEISAQSI